MASELRRGQAGGLANVERNGVDHMRAIGRHGGLKGGHLGGRPTWQETLRKAKQREEEARQRARGRG